MARPTKHEQRYKNVGRPTVMTDITLKKLEDAAALDASVEEMCFYADITPKTYYNYCDNNPEFLQRIQALRQKPILKARQAVVGGLESSPTFSFQYLKAKRPTEFAERQIVDHKGINTDEDDEDEDLIQEYEKKAQENIVKRIKEKKPKTP